MDCDYLSQASLFIILQSDHMYLWQIKCNKRAHNNYTSNYAHPTFESWLTLHVYSDIPLAAEIAQ